MQLITFSACGSYDVTKCGKSSLTGSSRVPGAARHAKLGYYRDLIASWQAACGALQACFNQV